MIIFRADSNSYIGAGHIMRCLSIADSFKSMGIDSIFVSADDCSIKNIAERGYEVNVLQSTYDKMDYEISQMQSILFEYDPDMLIVDSYFVTPEYLSALKTKVNLGYIDDLAIFPYPVHVLINYNIYASKEEYENLYSDFSKLPDKLLLGPAFVPLRSEFKGLISKKRKSKDVHDVLISTGGADPIHLGIKLLKEITEKPLEDIHYHILVGSLNADQEEIDRMAKGMVNVTVHKDVKHMSELILSCDFAISAGGSTLYEICACGLPFITYITADNQKKGVQSFEKAGLAFSCGDLRNDPLAGSKIMNLLTYAIEYLRKEDSIMESDRCPIDGYGADRIAKELLAYIRD